MGARAPPRFVGAYAGAQIWIAIHAHSREKWLFFEAHSHTFDKTTKNLITLRSASSTKNIII